MTPRVGPGTRAQLGPVNALLVKVIHKGARTPAPPNLFTTLGRHRGLFRRWLFFAGGLMPGGKIGRRESELVILRTAHRYDCTYEWQHHERIGKRAGLSAEEIARVRDGADAPGWDERDATLLRAVDDLYDDRVISDATWAAVERHFDERQRIELCLLAGHYAMLAMTIHSLGIQPDHDA